MEAGDGALVQVDAVPRRARKRRKGPPNEADAAVGHGHPLHVDREPVAASDPPAPAVLPVVHGAAALEVDDEEFQRLSRRQKYLWLYRRFAWWVSRHVERRALADLPSLAENPSVGDLLTYATHDFKALRVIQKNAVLQHWAEEVRAPESVVLTIDALWPPEVRAKDAHCDAHRFLYCKSALLTWQGPWGVVSMTAEQVRGRSVDAVVAELRQREDLLASWRAFEAFVKELAEEHFVRFYTLSFELCTQTLACSLAVRVHAHAFLLREDGRMEIRKKERANFLGSAAVKSNSSGARAVLRGSGVWCGCFYVVAPKIGSIFTSGSVRPYLDFAVKPEWIMNMVQAEKMTFASAMQQMSKCGKSYTRNMQDLQAWQAAKAELELADHVRRVQAHHSATNYGFKVYPEVEAWKASVWQPHLRRKKILVIEGPSGVGKTEFIKQLAGPERTLEISADGMTSPYLRNFIASQHKVIFWDECVVDMVIAYRKLFQCPASWITLGVSPTGRDVYRVWLNDAAHVIASNRWQQGLDNLVNPADRSWIEENQVYLRVTERMYIAAQGGGAAAA